MSWYILGNDGLPTRVVGRFLVVGDGPPIRVVGRFLVGLLELSRALGWPTPLG